MEQLLDAFNVQAVYSNDLHQVTIHATLTDATPHAIEGLLTDSRTDHAPPAQTPAHATQDHLSQLVADTGELALAADDEGHTGRPTDGLWAKNSLTLRAVFGVTSEHSLAQMSRAVITAYYGQPVAHSYYNGCSTGGREALMLAQRYPRDFNGIVAGASASNLAPLALFNAWMVRSNTGPDGHQILTAEQIRHFTRPSPVPAGTPRGSSPTRGTADSTPPRFSARGAGLPIRA